MRTNVTMGTKRPGTPQNAPPAGCIAVCTRAFQFGQKKFRFDSRYRIDFFDSIRQSDKFAACTLIFK